MKKLIVCLFAVALAAAARAAEALPVFNAILAMGKDQRFVLVSPTGKASTFLKLGESFDGYVLKSYEPKTSTLTVERDGKTTNLTLAADAAVANGPAAPTPATYADAAAVLGKMHFDEMMERIASRQTKAVGVSIEQSVSRMASIPGVEKEQLTALQKKMTDEIAKVFDPQQMKTDVTKIYSEIFTKEELDGLGAFYSTPLGETMAKKAPDVQDKLGAIIQARMMETMPRVQAMARDFVAEQRAKAGANGGAPATPATAPAPVPAGK